MNDTKAVMDAINEILKRSQIERCGNSFYRSIEVGVNGCAHVVEWMNVSRLSVVPNGEVDGYVGAKCVLQDGIGVTEPALKGGVVAFAEER